MDIHEFRQYCLSKPAATEDFPFDETTLTFRVGGKIFAITDLEGIPFTFNLKCDPERAIELRERYDAIRPGWHMNKKHWNTIQPDLGIEDDLIRELTDHSYELIRNSLTKKLRKELGIL